MHNIAGWNYQGTIKNNAALGKTVSATIGVVNRVVGASGGGTIADNYANYEMRLNGPIAGDAGASVDIDELDEEFFKKLFADFDANWIFPAGAKMPVLNWQKYAMTSYSVQGAHFYGDKIDLAEKSNAPNNPDLTDVKLHFYVENDYTLTINNKPLDNGAYEVDDDDIGFDADNNPTIEYTLTLTNSAGETVASRDIRHEVGLDYLVLVDDGFWAGGGNAKTNICDNNTTNNNHMKYFLLTQDLTNIGNTTCGGTGGAVPPAAQQFFGIFDGNGHSASWANVAIAGSYQGFFGYLSSAVVKNLSVSGSVIINGEYAGGIAGWNNGSTIKNTYFTGNITADRYAGGIAGENNGGTIKNTYSSGTVTAYGDSAGGIAGRNGGTIKNTYSTGSVEGRDSVGGIAGLNRGTIKNTYSTGSVTATEFIAGGIAGVNNGGTIKNTYSTGSVSGSSQVGGIAGANSGNGTITNNAALGKTVSGSSFVNRVVGFHGGNPLADNYANSEMFGATVTGDGNKNTEMGASIEIADELDGDFFAALFGADDFVDNWIFPAGAKMPVLNWQKYAMTSYSVHGAHFYGSKLELSSTNDPIDPSGIDLDDVWLHFYVEDGYKLYINDNTNEITDGEYEVDESTDLNTDATGIYIKYTLELKDREDVTVAKHDMRHDIGHNYLVLVDNTFWSGGVNANSDICDNNTNNHMKYFLLTDNLTNVSQTTCGGVDGGQPLTADRQFFGIFDGNGHSAGLNINIVSAVNVSYHGFFGYLSGGSVVKNLGVSGTVVTTGDHAGGIAGYNNGTIKNTYSNAIVTGWQTVGGIAGLNEGTIKNTYSTGSVTATGMYAGGIAGVNGNGGTIKNTYSTGNVEGYSRVGGIAGANYGGTIKNTYSTGDVKGADRVGGIAGENNSTITDNAALMQNINATSAPYGRIIGDNHAPTVSDNYAFSGMTANGNWTIDPLQNGNPVDKGIGDGNISNPGFWISLNFSETIWDLKFDKRTNNYKLPLLKNLLNQPTTLKPHLQQD